MFYNEKNSFLLIMIWKGLLLVVHVFFCWAAIDKVTLGKVRKDIRNLTRDHLNDPIKVGGEKPSVSRMLPDFSPPDFFILGATKCGTTSLHQLLLTHREICDSGAKELHYFDHPSEYNQGSARYMRRFKQCKNGGKHYIDATPNYLDHLEVPGRLAVTFSPKEIRRKKFIIVLRDPVYRSYSWYNHVVKNCVAHMHSYMVRLGGNSGSSEGWNTTSLCDIAHCSVLQCKSRAAHAVVGREVESLATFAQYYSSGALDVSKGHYMTQINKWLEVVQRNQLFIINLSTLLTNTTSTLSALTQFLGLQTPFPPGTAFPHDNTATVPTEFQCQVRRELYRQLDPHTQRLMNYMAPPPGGGAGGTRERPEDDGRPVMEPPFPPFQEYRC